MALEHILYISGSGRSGSTVLERVLHTSPDFFAVGELHCLWRLPHDEITCACGAKLIDDLFWKDVFSRAGIARTEIAELRGLEARLARTSFVGRSTLARLTRDPRVARFMELQRSLFSGIADVSGARVIVDSSKAGPRAWLLATDPQTRILHLYRSPADVLASWRSRKFDPGMQRDMQRLSLTRASLDWLKVEILANRLRKQSKVAEVNYDSFVNSPRTVLAEALSPLGLADHAPQTWTGVTSFRDGPDYHSVNGNPDRFGRDEVQIKARPVDRTKLDRSDRVMIPLAAAAMKLVYPAPK